MEVRVVKGPISHGFRYAHDGEVIDMPEQMALLYIKVGRVVEEQVKRRRVYRRRDVQPEQTAVMSAETDE